MYLERALASLILDKVKQVQPQANLTEAELAVLELIAIGTDYEAIPFSLQITLETFNTYIAKIIARFYLSQLTHNSAKAKNLA